MLRPYDAPRGGGGQGRGTRPVAVNASAVLCGPCVATVVIDRIEARDMTDRPAFRTRDNIDLNPGLGDNQRAARELLADLTRRRLQHAKGRTTNPITQTQRDDVIGTRPLQDFAPKRPLHPR